MLYYNNLRLKRRVLCSMCKELHPKITHESYRLNESESFKFERFQSQEHWSQSKGGLQATWWDYPSSCHLQGHRLPRMQLSQALTARARQNRFVVDEQRLRVNYPSRLVWLGSLGDQRWSRQQATRHIISKQANKEIYLVRKSLRELSNATNKSVRTTGHKFSHQSPKHPLLP